MSLIEFTDRGFYCSAGGFYIDPWRPVEHAIITHAHSDHARWGHQHYLCHHLTKPLLQLRLGQQSYQSLGWNETLNRNGVTISLHPAGHIIGSSQVRIEFKGQIWVISGDYKTEDDGLSGAFEPIACHTFITECTFGLPVYNWQPQEELYTTMRKWVYTNQQQGMASVIFAYSLGKAQRVVQALAQLEVPIYVHGSVWNTHEQLLSAGIALPMVKRVTPATQKSDLQGSIVIAPMSAKDSPWLQRFAPYKTAVCSGWMQLRGNARRQSVDAGFALSDHADWNGLLSTIKATGAQQVYTTHGFQATFSRYLNETGIDAAEVTTEFGGEEGATEPSEPINETGL
jgi:putative mRNA 3-end processing factor